MMPPFYEEIANATTEFEGTYARGFKLDAYKKLLADTDALRPHILAKISAHSHGQDDEAAKWFAITIYAIKDGKRLHTRRHGWGAVGLYRALRNAKAYDDEGKFDGVLVEFTNNGHVTVLPHDLWLLTLELGKNIEDLSPLTDWCREFMQDYDWE